MKASLNGSDTADSWANQIVITQIKASKDRSNVTIKMKNLKVNRAGNTVQK